MKTWKIKVLASLLLAATACAATAQSMLEDIQKSRQIRIAVPTDFAPYGFVDADMQPKGLDIDMANLVAAKLGAKAVLVPVTSANRIPYLQTHKVDIVISTLGKNAEREKVVDFTAAYSPFFIGVFGPKAMAVKGGPDLAGKSIGVTRGSMDDMELSKVAPSSATLRRFEDNNSTIAAFAAGQTQLVATSVQVADVLMKNNPQLNTEFKFVLKVSPNFIGLPKNEDKLRARLNDILAAAKASGELDKLSQKWLGRPAGELPE
ncbi:MULTISPECIES: transporter substrate-binding domain-containing protein [unclassified Herbaspirillum]|uniref:transporter substrate-binding domain-containing protein n=1 Tax=unclassified Herbaspirillum TaxID=2624150 RepID=UPI00114DD8BA|nr:MULTISPECIES: transporter substrate-binding domain-containing protein [unclassified Herbaspirillum]MBB5390599.1 polar amino acid transport system substrate-binding protein [Herbaspirillum sp. SJZ102]TQK08913.1 amino acid ABC transporter substrate-binding protein (PAAT family) [Herbaspirillum sp. SJZ130]TQK14400.1 amino acid ABC transporter substrate-binding protein (PAAT family) [Herbaspirillum sp. SJZ106]